MTDRLVVLVTGAGSGIGRAVATVLARAGHCVYASLRLGADHGRARATQMREMAAREGFDLRVVDLDVLSEPSCRAAVDQVLFEQGRIDVVMNNAGMLMVGMGEAFTPEQLARILDINAVSWLRVNRAALPAMRRQGRGVLVYIGSTTATICEPFMAPYVASKAAGDALAEAMSFEVSRFGIESVIVVPGAFTSGTEHFAHAQAPADGAVVVQYGDLPGVIDTLGGRLEAIDAANGGSLDVSAVGEAVRDVLAKPHGTRPPRVVVDGQRKGVEELNALHRAKQTAFFRQLGIDGLMTLPENKRLKARRPGCGASAIGPAPVAPRAGASTRRAALDLRLRRSVHGLPRANSWDRSGRDANVGFEAPSQRQPSTPTRSPAVARGRRGLPHGRSAPTRPGHCPPRCRHSRRCSPASGGRAGTGTPAGCPCACGPAPSSSGAGWGCRRRTGSGPANATWSSTRRLYWRVVTCSSAELSSSDRSWPDWT